MKVYRNGSVLWTQRLFVNGECSLVTRLCFFKVTDGAICKPKQIKWDANVRVFWSQGRLAYYQRTPIKRLSLLILPSRQRYFTESHKSRHRFQVITIRPFCDGERALVYRFSSRKVLRPPVQGCQAVEMDRVDGTFLAQSFL